MKLRTKRRLMTLASVVVLVAAAWGFLSAWNVPAWPEATANAEAPAEASAGRGPTAAASAAWDPQSETWRRRLREPLYDPPPPPPPEKKPLPPLRSKLIGTILQPGASQAIIEAPGGRVEFRSEGDELGPHDQEAVVVEIGPSSVKVARGEEVTELKVESPY